MFDDWVSPKAAVFRGQHFSDAGGQFLVMTITRKPNDLTTQKSSPILITAIDETKGYGVRITAISDDFRK